MSYQDMSEARQLAVKHNHSLFRLSGCSKTIRELVNDVQHYLSVATINIILSELSDVERRVKKVINAKFEAERGIVATRKRAAKSK